ncbi:hypothetical protein Pfo_023939 [Paulownia fortunei]|nr:hypothetical protein Pfo_023939 [Paulownia fortunei]
MKIVLTTQIKTHDKTKTILQIIEHIKKIEIPPQTRRFSGQTFSLSFFLSVILFLSLEFIALLPKSQIPDLVIAT